MSSTWDLFGVGNKKYNSSYFIIHIAEGYSHIPNSRTYTFIYFPKNRRPIRSY